MYFPCRREAKDTSRREKGTAGQKGTACSEPGDFDRQRQLGNAACKETRWGRFVKTSALGVNEVFRMRFQGGAAGAWEVLLTPVESVLRMPPTPSAQRVALVLRAHLSLLLCSWTQASFPLSEMQKNLTFTKDGMLFQKNNHDHTEGCFLSWRYEKFHLFKPEPRDLPNTQTPVSWRSLTGRSPEL